MWQAETLSPGKTIFTHHATFLLFLPFLSHFSNYHISPKMIMPDISPPPTKRGWAYFPILAPLLYDNKL
jgi:hypothetical protein